MSPILNFTETRKVGKALIHADRRTDMTKAFRHYAISLLLKPLQVAPHRRNFAQAFEIALFSIRSVQTH
jgi:hypothetical protein